MANTVSIWRGAVEPAESSPSGNEVRTWRGAVEPVGATGGGPGGPNPGVSDAKTTGPGLSFGMIGRMGA